MFSCNNDAIDTALGCYVRIGGRRYLREFVIHYGNRYPSVKFNDVAAHQPTIARIVPITIEAQAPIILAACPAADDLYTLYDNMFTRFVYKKLRMPLPMLRGLGPTLLPRPIKLTHEISMPIFPPKPSPDPALHAEQISDFKRLAEDEMDELMELAASHHELRYGH